ncbi:MAG: hypothetical protein SFU91_00995 [Chloroherpetonaceae bacterium]|nr:hypothetical protein [Chloroherpetonaceae bacterium]
MKKLNPHLAIKIKLSAVFLFTFTFLANAQEGKRESLSLTIYNDNLALVRESRKVQLPSGNTSYSLTDIPERIDPTSVRVKFNGSVFEQNYQYDLVSADKILQRYIDKPVTLKNSKGDFISGLLLSSNAMNAVIQTENNGKKGITMIQNLQDYQVVVTELPSGFVTKPTLQWLLNSQKAGEQTLDVSYQTRGMSWHAEYVATLNKDETMLDLAAWVSIENNSGTTYPNAKIKLIAGDINRIKSNEDIGFGGAPPTAVMGYQRKAEPQFKEESFFEYHIYELQRPSSLQNNETKQISLFDVSPFPFEKKYLFSSGRNDEKIKVVVEFQNAKKFNLGIPFPKGKVRVNKARDNGVEFIGEDQIDHTPTDERIKLNIGNAFDLVGQEEMKESEQVSNRVTEQTYKVTLKNRKPNEDVVIEVEKNFYGNWKILSSTLEYEKINATTIRFKPKVSRGKELSFEYKVRLGY